MTVSQPTLTVIAGPLGAGKSTFTRATQEALRVPVIDPDSIAIQQRPDNPEAAAIAGGKWQTINNYTAVAGWKLVCIFGSLIHRRSYYFCLST